MRFIESNGLRRYLAWPLGVLVATLLLIGLGRWFLLEQTHALQTHVQQQVAHLDRLVRQVEFLKNKRNCFILRRSLLPNQPRRPGRSAGARCLDRCIVEHSKVVGIETI